MNIKIAKTEHPVIDLIKNRWSPRSFSDKPVSHEDMMTIFEAASWAFSASNEQPWEYIYAHRQDQDAFHKLHDCLLPGNKPWTKYAAVLGVSLVRKKMTNGKKNTTAKHDLGAANATMMLQATSMGIYGHMMAGFDHDKTFETLGLNKEELDAVAFFAMGYPDSPEKLEEPFKTRELTQRTRKPISEFTRRLK
jgi:nitroreductase